MTIFKKSLFFVFIILCGIKGAWALEAGDQGYGIMLGNPSGLSGKIWLNHDAAIDGAFGVDGGELDAHLSLLWHDETIPKQLHITDHLQGVKVPFYFGIGPRVIFGDNPEFGIRTPVGLSFLPDGTDWEIFTELAPVLRLTPDVGFDGNFAVGVRYYFKAIRPK